MSICIKSINFEVKMKGKKKKLLIMNSLLFCSINDLQDAPPITFKCMNASSNPFKFETKKNSSPESSFLTFSILNVER